MQRFKKYFLSFCLVVYKWYSDYQLMLILYQENGSHAGLTSDFEFVSG